MPPGFIYEQICIYFIINFEFHIENESRSTLPLCIVSLESKVEKVYVILAFTSPDFFVLILGFQTLPKIHIAFFVCTGKLVQQSVVRLFQYLEISDEDREQHRIYDTEIIELGQCTLSLSLYYTVARSASGLPLPCPFLSARALFRLRSIGY